MIVEEKVAQRTKWCPEVRIKWIGTTWSSNRSHVTWRYRFRLWLYELMFPNLFHWSKGYVNKCYGSKCMMWRWHDEKNKTGYCGLAREPK